MAISLRRRGEDALGYDGIHIFVVLIISTPEGINSGADDFV
jgi:hypothetical protein